MLRHWILVLTLALTATGGSAQTSCGSWEALAAVGYTGSGVQISAVAADAASHQTYVSIDCGCGYHGFVQAEIYRWAGSGWQLILDTSSNCDTSRVHGMRVLDLGSGPQLYAWGSFTCFPSIGSLLRWSGSAFVSLVPPPGGTECLAAFDNGSGLALYAGSPIGVYRWDGASWISLGAIAPSSRTVTQLVVHDDGSGPALYAGGTFTSLGGTICNGVARWNGSGWSALGTGFVGATSPNVSVLRSIRDWGGPALYAGGRFTLADGLATNGVARWNGTAWQDIGSTHPGSVSSVSGMEWFDAGTGLGPVVVVSASYTGASDAVMTWDGATWSPSTSAAFTLYPGPLCVTDMQAPDGLELLGERLIYISSWPDQAPARLAACDLTGELFCFGDGVLASCPCGNDGATLDHAGCVNSLGLAGSLRARGRSSIASDTLVLSGASMPDSSALYFQGANQVAPFAFGDGLKCTASPFVRLRTKTNAGGASSYPEASDPPVSVKGFVSAPGTRHYQVHYRNAAAFCTEATFNYTNAVTILWAP